MKCSSGREFDVKPLNIEQRVEIDEEIAKYYYSLGVNLADAESVAKAPLPFTIALKACRYAGIDADDLSTIEIIELFTEIHNISHLADVQKKS